MIKRVKAFRFWVWLICPPLGVAAQTGQLVSSARKIDSGTTVEVTKEPSHVATVNRLVLPLFGEQTKTSEQISWEVNFLNNCDQNFASRSEASQFFSTRAWEYLAEGQLDTATYRFNLAWLLNNKTADPYWGLGVVNYKRGKLPEAIRLLEKGVAVADTNATLMTDLATVQLKYYNETKDNNLLTAAVSWLKKSLQYDQTDPNAYLRLSWTSYVQEHYDTAWEYLHKARMLDMSAIDFTYLKELMEKAPDPQGFFK